MLRLLHSQPGQVPAEPMPRLFTQQVDTRHLLAHTVRSPGAHTADILMSGSLVFFLTLRSCFFFLFSFEED